MSNVQDLQNFEINYCTASCPYSDGNIYASLPPKIKCTLNDEYYLSGEPCSCKKIIKEKEENNMEENNSVLLKAEEVITVKSEKPKKKMLVVNLFGSPGTGKCFAPGTKVLMYDGTIKNIEDIKIGDQVMGDDSTPRNVLELHNGNSLMYDVSFTSFKETIRVSEGHILTYLRSYYKKGSRWYTVEDEKIEDFLQESKHVQQKAKAFKKGIDYPTKNLVVDPYYLGLWLGDGISENFTTICTADNEILNYFNEYSKKLGVAVSQQSYKKDTNCQKYALTLDYTGYQGEEILPLFAKEENLINNKHIPLSYLTSDRQQRLKLLAGLVDSDGYLCYNYIEIVQKNNQLSQDIVQLCNSLGFNCYSKKIKKAPSNYPESIGEYNQITISGSVEDIPVLLDRKKCKIHHPNKNYLHSFMEITSVGKGNYYGFSTDGNQRFLLANSIVVHNSTFAAYIFSQLKMRGVNAELATEFAKDKVWEESVEVFKNQAYIFGKQYFRLSRVKDKVDVIVTDSPIILSMFYNNQPELDESFDHMCMKVFNSFNNYNVFLTRVKPYNPAGRFQTEEESDALVRPMIDMLHKNGIIFDVYNGNQESADKIVENIMKKLEEN